MVENHLQASWTFPPRSAVAFSPDALSVPFATSTFTWALLHVLAACPMPTWLTKALAEWVTVMIA